MKTLAAVLTVWLLIACRAPGEDAAAAAPVTTVPATAAPAATQTVVNPSYTLYPGDRLQITVFDHPDLTVIIHVPTNGIITFPLIGDVVGLVGRTVEDLRAELKRRLEDGYITEAIITVSFLQFGTRSAFVMGSVKNPSSIALDPFAPLTAMQAISKSGGFSEGANRSAAHIIRDDRDTGRKVAIPIPTGDTAEQMRADVVLQPGDILVIPRMDRIFILGQVKRPGAIDIPGQEALTVSKAISLAGGFERFGKQTEVQIIRAGVQVRLVDVKKVLAGDRGAEDPTLLPGDTVFVPETRF